MYYEIVNDEPFKVRTPETRFGWFFTTRFLFSVRATGGKYWHQALWYGTQIWLAILALVMDSIIFLAGHFVIAIYLMLKFVLSHWFVSINKKALEPILHIFSVVFAFAILYILYTTGLWKDLLKTLSYILQQWF